MVLLLEALGSSGSDTATPDDAFSILAAQPRQQFAQMLGDLRMILAGPSIQARCLECGPVAPARVSPQERSLLQLIEAWLS